MIKDAEPKEDYSFPEWNDSRFIRMQFELQTMAQECRDFVFPNFENSSVVMQDNEIIHVADVVFRFQSVFYELIEFVEINICEELGCEVAQGHSFSWIFCFMVVQDYFNEPNNVQIAYLLPDNAQKNLMIHAVEIMLYVSLECTSDNRVVIPFTRIIFPLCDTFRMNSSNRNIAACVPFPFRFAYES